MRFATLALALSLALPAAAQSVAPQEWARDPQTAEPVPFSAVPAPERPDAPAELGGGGLELLEYLPFGSTKVARVVGDLVVYQDGGAVVVARIVDDGEGLLPLDTLTFAGQPSDIAIDGDYAYVAQRKAQGFDVLDLSDPENVTIAGRVAGYEGISIAVANGHAYLGMGTAGIAVFDVSDPANPTHLQSFDTPGSANGFAIEGELLLSADGNSANFPDFQVYSIANPADPLLLGTVEAGAFVTGVAVRGTTAYLAGGFGIMTVDLSDPTLPATLDALSLGDDTTYEVSLVGNTAYVAGLAGVFAVDVSDPSALAIVGSYTETQQVLAVEADPARGLAFVSDRYVGLRVLDASDPAALTEIALAGNGGFSARAVFEGDYLYVTDLAGKLRIFDVSALPDGPAMLLGMADVPSNTQEVVVRGDLAYVTDADFGGTGLTILNVADPTTPTIVGSWGSANQVFGLDVVGTTVYLCNGFSGLVVLDAADPENIAELGSFPIGANATDVVVRDEVAYLVSFGGGMRTLDVSDPANITELDAEAGWGFLNGIAAAGAPGLFNVADGQLGLRVVDASDPANLMSVSTSPTASQARDVASASQYGEMSGNVAYVADDFFGLRAFVNGTLQDAFESGDRGFGVAVTAFEPYRDLIALMSGETGIHLFASPQGGLAGEDGPDAAALAVEAVWPNPVQRAATVRYTVPAAGAVTLEAYDVLGRRVAVLHDGPVAAGRHEATWQAAVPSGVYVLRLRTADEAVTTRVTVVR